MLGVSRGYYSRGCGLLFLFYMWKVSFYFIYEDFYEVSSLIYGGIEKIVIKKNIWNELKKFELVGKCRFLGVVMFFCWMCFVGDVSVGVVGFFLVILL